MPSLKASARSSKQIALLPLILGIEDLLNVEGLFEETHCLGIGIDGRRAGGGFLPVVYPLRKVIASGVVVGEHLVELMEPIGVELFYGPADFPVDLLSPGEEEAVVGNFLREGMLEDVLEFGEEPLLVDQFETLEVEQVGFQVFFHLRDGLEDAKGELPADHGGDVHDSFETFVEAVDTGGDDPLDGVGDLDVGELPGEDVVILSLSGSTRSQGDCG